MFAAKRSPKSHVFKTDVNVLSKMLSVVSLAFYMKRLGLRILSTVL